MILKGWIYQCVRAVCCCIFLLCLARAVSAPWANLLMILWIFLKNQDNIYGRCFHSHRLGMVTRHIRAIQLLQEITFCDFTIKSGAVTEGQSLIFLEGLKTVREIVAPFSGVVLEANESVCSDLSLLNRDPEKSGWLILFQGIPTDGIFLQTEDIDAGNSTLDN